MSISETGSSSNPPEILVVEDNFLAASQLCDIVRDSGFAVAGSVARVSNGLDFLSGHAVDAAIVDINLNGTFAFPLCAELERRKVPYWFLTGYQPSIIPAEFSNVPRLAKPADPAAIRAALASMLPQRGEKPAPRPSPPLPGNSLLQTLEPKDWAALEPHLEQIALHPGEVLEHPGLPVQQLVFPLSGLLSMETGSGNNRLQVAMIGREGMAGTPLLLGQDAASSIVTVQYEGHAWRAEAAALHGLLAEHQSLRGQLLRGVGALMAQISSNGLAAARRTIEERVARWLLMASDRLQVCDIAISHETLAQMLGVRRAGVTVALHVLEGKGALRSGRMRVQLLDRAQLAALSGAVSGGAASDSPTPMGSPL